MLGSLPVMVGGGGRGGAALLAGMVAILFYNTSKAVCHLDDPLHLLSSSTMLK